MRDKVINFFEDKRFFNRIKILDDVSHHYGLTRISTWGFSILELIRKENINTEKELWDRIEPIFMEHVETLLQHVNRYLSIIKSDLKITLKQCFYYYYNLFIIRTMKGRLMELDFKRILEKKLDNVRFSTVSEDGHYSVDIVVEGTYGVQVKPISYLYMNKPDVKELNNKKYKMFELDYGYPVIEVYYDKNNKWVVHDEQFKNFYYNQNKQPI